MGSHKTLEEWEAWRAALQSKFKNNGHGRSLSIELRRAERDGWGIYEPAIRRWEHALGRVAPAPVRDDKVNTEFTEWMMDYPEGWVSAVGISTAQQRRAIGNGVVTRQATAALEHLRERFND